MQDYQIFNYWLTGIITVLLFIYLLFALFNAQDMQ